MQIVCYHLYANLGNANYCEMDRKFSVCLETQEVSGGDWKWEVRDHKETHGDGRHVHDLDCADDLRANTYVSAYQTVHVNMFIQHLPTVPQ